MSLATAVRAFRQNTLLESVRGQSTLDALATARPSGQVVAVCGLHDDAAGSTVTDHLAGLLGRFHRGRVVVLDADLDRGTLAGRAGPDARLELDDLETFLRTSSNVAPPWDVAAPVVGDLGAHPASHVADLLRWSRARLDTVLIDVSSRWRRAVLDSLLPSIDVVVVTARAGQRVAEEVGVARHWLNSQGRQDLAESLLVVESAFGPGEAAGRPRGRGSQWFRLGPADGDAGWAGLSRRDRDELLRLGAALRR